MPSLSTVNDLEWLVHTIVNKDKKYRASGLMIPEETFYDPIGLLIGEEY